MTAAFERRLRRVEKAITGAPEDRVLVVGLPGQADPSAEEIARASHVLRVVFVSPRPGHAQRH